MMRFSVGEITELKHILGLCISLYEETWCAIVFMANM